MNMHFTAGLVVFVAAAAGFAAPVVACGFCPALCATSAVPAVAATRSAIDPLHSHVGIRLLMERISPVDRVKIARFRARTSPQPSACNCSVQGFRFRSRRLKP